MSEFEGVVEALQELVDDNTVPQNTRAKISKMMGEIKSNTGAQDILVSKLQDEIEAINDDANLPSYVKTQLMNISCMLELF